MSEEARYDVAVAGAGVAGTFLAYLTAKAGLSTVIVESKSEDRIGEKVCGDAVGEHHFREVGLEPPRLGVDAVGVMEGIRVFSPSKEYWVTAWGKGYALDRKAFGRRLLKMALDAGAELMASSSVVKPLVDGDWVKGVLVSGKSGKVHVKSQVVVDATGVAAAVRTKLPNRWWVSRRAPPYDFNAAYRAVATVEEVQDTKLGLIYLDVEAAPGGYWWWFPKSGQSVNAGLGVQVGRGNPKDLFERHVLPELRKAGARIEHVGGGMVPTRRPAPCLVWNGFVAVGDAAYTANPIHGGGIGPALVSSYHAANQIVKAFEAGEPSLKALWPYHKAYIGAYGAKQAALDVVRMYLQALTNDDIELVIRSGIVSDRELSLLGYEGELVGAVVSKLLGAMRLLRKPSLLSQIARLKRYMDEARRLYLEFPEDPEGYEAWFTRCEALYERIRREFWRGGLIKAENA